MLNEKIYIPQNIFYFSEDLSGEVGLESSSLSLNSQLFVIIVDILVFYTFVNVGIISVFLLFFIAVEQWFGKSPIIKGENVKREGCTFQQSTNSCISSFRQEISCPILVLSFFPRRNQILFQDSSEAGRRGGQPNQGAKQRNQSSAMFKQSSMFKRVKNSSV